MKKNKYSCQLSSQFRKLFNSYHSLDKAKPYSQYKQSETKISLYDSQLDLNQESSGHQRSYFSNLGFNKRKIQKQQTYAEYKNRKQRLKGASFSGQFYHCKDQTLKPQQKGNKHKQFENSLLSVQQYNCPNFKQQIVFQKNADYIYRSKLQLMNASRNKLKLNTRINKTGKNIHKYRNQVPSQNENHYQGPYRKNDNFKLPDIGKNQEKIYPPVKKQILQELQERHFLIDNFPQKQPEEEFMKTPHFNILPYSQLHEDIQNRKPSFQTQKPQMTSNCQKKFTLLNVKHTHTDRI